LAAFGETSISACNDSHSLQATAALVNTPNLIIGSQTKETLHWFIRPGLLYWFPDWDYYTIIVCQFFGFSE